jgi:hypothetical protein
MPPAPPLNRSDRMTIVVDTAPAVRCSVWAVAPNTSGTARRGEWSSPRHGPERRCSGRRDLRPESIRKEIRP